MNKISFIWIFLMSGTLSWLVTKIAIYFFPKINLLDFPHRYGLKRKRIPYPGGLAFFPLYIGILWFDISFWPIIVLLAILTGVCFWDDQKNLPALPRIILHISLAIILVLLNIKITVISDPINQTNILLPNMFQWIITVGWIVFLQNALNWFDGLKGLCVGTAGIGFLALGVLSLFRPELFFDPNQLTAIKSSFWLAGLCFGAFPLFFQGKILLGDTGSQVLGFLLAVFSIIAGAKIATTLIVLAIPLLDTFAVIIRRIFIDKKSPFKGDQKHFHHQLSNIAWANKRAF